MELQLESREIFDFKSIKDLLLGNPTKINLNDQQKPLHLDCLNMTVLFQT